MPTISVDKAELYKRLEKEYTQVEFDQLCFDFGIELDEDTTEEVAAAKKAGLPTEEPVLKIEIPANRYDLLCIEGLARALRIFLNLQSPPDYKLSTPSSLLEVTISSSTSPIRPYFAGAILRLKEPLTEASYKSFIDLQDKLHSNLCRNRKFVAIGTHDLDKLTPPFRYEAQAPKDIKFVPLNKDKEYTAEELMTLYETDRHLGKYLPIIKDSPVYPIIYDAEDRVLSMPPIINSEHSKITLNTRNVFIDMAAADPTKLEIVASIMSTMFSEYCETPYTIEPVKIISPDGSSRITPNLTPRSTTAQASYINSATGFAPALSPSSISELLIRMSLNASVSPSDEDVLIVQVPPTRPDILHECDIMEDAAVAYGFNNLPKTFPRTNTIARPLPINKLSDLIRKECAMAGWTEVLPYILCAHDENFAWLNQKDPGNYAISLSNPKTVEYQIVRTSLLPGLLKTLRENKQLPLPVQIFEVSDVAIQDASEERKSRNIRKVAGLWSNKSAGFEIVHGLLDRLMQILGVAFIGSERSEAKSGYYIKETSNPTYFPGRAASIFYRPVEHTSQPAPPQAHLAADPAPTSTSSSSTEGPLDTLKGALSSVLPSVSSGSKDIEIGVLGILHPEVLGKFEIEYPCSGLEFDLEHFL
ncbi:phenylalanyl-trna synthetase subunit beta [Phaffia rhodozyma]|uniref:Phenylalanine--tRNA ligase beta subunit n=1 Tax=Phaffia rhodozyma TaxID=264483 RepID=A0A0F7SK82_PHARH|nr:phenylalanyl-trna synthetase subunit beta [Phaffia rhodozyma]